MQQVFERRTIELWQLIFHAVVTC